MVNIAILMGRLTADPELKHTASDIPVTRFSIAVNRNYSKGPEKQTDFFDVVVWRSTAEFVCKYFKKGSAIIVEGQFQTGSFEGKDGIKRKTFELVASNVYFAEAKSRDGSSYSNSGSTGSNLDRDVSGYSNDASFDSDESEDDVDDDDLPF